MDSYLATSGLQLPAGYEIEFAGESAQCNDAVGNLMASVGVLAVMMVAALVLSFRSFRLAMLIGVVAFLSVGLGLGALWTAGFPFGFMAIVGTMGLVGVAINDSIVVLAAIQGDEAARNGDAAAIRNVVFRATRHVVATSLTTIAGFLPLIVSGGGFWPPMAVTIAGGVGGATVLALIFVPACYLLLMQHTAANNPHVEHGIEHRKSMTYWST
ncbi:MAG: efflux RND transporter permease subunit [Planctomycetaceae bacterium]